MQIPQLRTRQLRKLVALPRGHKEKRFLASDLCALLETYLSPSEVADAYRAYLFGAEAHEGQLRRSGEPYIYHPIAVARILAEMRLDAKTITAALLHDVIEDTSTRKEAVAREFGADVAELVDGVSKIERIAFNSPEDAQAENFRKMLMAMARDIRVIIIKLADRLHNMRTLEHMAAEKRRFIAKQTLDIYAPIANRLGMYQWCHELEDLAFSHLYPARYGVLERAMRRRQGNQRSLVKKIEAAMEKRLHQEGIEGRVFGREKNLYSIYEKMRSKHRTFDEVHDALGFRVIVNSPDECYRALGIVHGLYKPIPGRFKDYVAIPKANGYQSLHTVVFGPFGQPVEIQIRTDEMDRVAEVGVAAHWLYKSGDTPKKGGTHVAHELARSWLLEFLETQEKSGSPREFLEHLKIDLFPDEVYVFTPKGDIKKLPRSATALDFAYAVHSDVGNHCIGVKINNKRVPLRTELRNGDHVEIETSSSGTPHPSWLNYVITNKARAGIRTFLKTRKRRESVRLGKRLLTNALKSLGVRKLTEDGKQALLSILKFSDWDELLADIGLGNRLALVVARQYQSGVGDNSPDVQGADKAPPLVIRGTEGLMINFARCCRPIPGDPILGFLTAGRGMVIHTEDCPNVGEYRKHPEKWIDVQWERGIKGTFAVTVRVDTHNKRGVLARLAAVIAESEANIENVTMEDRDGIYTSILFTMEVRNRRHLADIMRRLRSQEFVTRINRVKG